MRMSVREHPSEDSETRQYRAEQTDVTDIRKISGDQFGADVTVFEVDVINESGYVRENITIVPEILFENTKDVQHRHEAGIVGKYSRALALESDEARDLLLEGISQARDEAQQEIERLEQKDARLLHTQADLNGL